MFFCIGNYTAQPLAFNTTVNSFTVHIDDGWNQYNKILYKGYINNGSLQDKVKSNHYQQPESGNYCILDFSNDFVLYHDDCRSFPLYMGKDFVTNHPTIGGQQVYFDASAVHKNNNFIYQHTASSKYRYNDSDLNFEQVVNALCEYLINTVEKFETDLPIYTTFTGGMDSTLVNSAFDYVGKAYTEHQITESCAISHWAYNQLPVTNMPQLQLTGFYGDTVLMRNPVMVNTLLSVHNIDLKKLYINSNGYTKPVYEKKYRKQMHLSSKFDKVEDARRQVHNQMVNNFEIWHYNNCVTFTPFKNNHLIHTMLNADADTLVKQCLNAEVSRASIKRLNPNNLARINKNK